MDLMDQITKLSDIPPSFQGEYRERFLTLLDEIVEWKWETFGPAQPAAFMARAGKEVYEMLLELEQGRDISEELADIVIVYSGLTRGRGKEDVEVSPGILFGQFSTQDVQAHGALIARYAAQIYLAATMKAFLTVTEVLSHIYNNVFIVARLLDINLLAALNAKFEKNKARTWAINDGLAQHISEGAGYVD